MSDVSLPFGPWKRIATAQWTGHPVSVYVNTENLVLLTVFDKRDGDVKGLLVMLKKPLLVDGKTDAFAASNQRDLTLVERITAERRVKYLLLDATPYYVPYTQSDLVATLNRQYQELSGASKILMDAAATFDFAVRAPETNDANLETLLGDPLTLFLLSGSAGAKGSAPGTPLAPLLLGKDAQGPLQLPPASILRTAVLGGSHSGRLRILHALAEAALSAGMPALVFDRSGVFGGLGELLPAPGDLESFGLTRRAAAFPTKTYALGKGLLIDLRHVDNDWFCTLLGLTDASLRAVIARAYPDCPSLEDLIQKVRALPDDRQTPQYAVKKTLRALLVLQKAHPATFGKNTFDELGAPWSTGIGALHRIALSGVEPVLQELLALSLLRQLKAPPKPACLLVLFDAPAADVSSRIQHAVPADAALALSAEHEADLLDKATLELDELAGDVAVSLPHQSKRRITLRPFLTRFAPPA